MERERINNMTSININEYVDWNLWMFFQEETSEIMKKNLHAPSAKHKILNFKRT